MISRAGKPDQLARPVESEDSAWAALHARLRAGGLPRTVIVGNAEKSSTADAVDQVTRKLAGKAEVVTVDLDRELAQASHVEDVDFFLVIGGDGTLLSAARSLQFRQVPLVGIHLGHLGFLTAFTQDEFPRHLDKLLSGQVPVSRRITLECCIYRASPVPADDGQPKSCPPGVAAAAGDPGEIDGEFCGWAINDCVVTAGPPFKMIRLRLYVDRQPMTEVMGDGLIVSTPGGSTAYNLSAGGPVVGATVKAMVVTPICAHSITHRPAVVDESSLVEIVADRVNAGTTCFLDGQIRTPIRDGDRIVVRRGKYELLLARHPSVGEWQALQQRLHWGQLPSLK